MKSIIHKWEILQSEVGDMNSGAPYERENMAEYGARQVCIDDLETANTPRPLTREMLEQWDSWWIDGIGTIRSLKEELSHSCPSCGRQTVWTGIREDCEDFTCWDSFDIIGKQAVPVERTCYPAAVML